MGRTGQLYIRESWLENNGNGEYLCTDCFLEAMRFDERVNEMMN